MVIQHNMPAINSQNRFKKNNSRLSKSLEKLSSGYAVNRAGDNAAGLAVSEKMRSQICGIKQSVQNCADGVSLIQTFEGALGETVSIIHRARSLAEQAANGTYQDDVDREAIEIEYLQLCDEVNHIAETDFNGVVMLTGGKDISEIEKFINTENNFDISTKSNAVSAAVRSAAVASAAVYSARSAEAVSLFAAPRAGGTVCGDFTVYGDSSNFSFDSTSGVLTILGGDVTVEGTGAATTNTIVVAKDKSANVTLNNVNIDVSSIDGACAFKIEDDSSGNVSVILNGNNVLKSGKDCAGLQKNGDISSGTLTIDGIGSLNANGGSYGGAGIGGGSGADGSNIIINNGTITATSLFWGLGSGGMGAGIGGGANGSGNNITINGGKITAYCDGYGAGVGGGYSGTGNNITINNGTIVAEGNWGAGIGGGNAKSGTNIVINGGTIIATSRSGAGIGGGQASLVKGAGGKNITINGGIIEATSQNGAGIGGGIGSCGYDIVINGGTVTSKSDKGAGIGGGGYSGGCVGITITGGIISALSNEGSGIGGGDEVFDSNYGSADADKITISGGSIIAVSTGDGYGIGGRSSWASWGNNNFIVEGECTVIAKGGKGAADIGCGEFGEADSVLIKDKLIKEPYTGNTLIGTIVDGTIIHVRTNTPLDPSDKLIVSTRPNRGEAVLTYTDNLTLQAGSRTKDSVNFTFAYNSDELGGLEADLDCTANGLGMDKLSLATQEKANLAIDKLDNALNKVSMIRSTFGAAQNRLEHKIDDLNNTSENLTYAESRIRDTDMAKEMMNFTKEQILTQSSQAMLAQANSLPQSVLNLIAG